MVCTSKLVVWTGLDDPLCIDGDISRARVGAGHKKTASEASGADICGAVGREFFLVNSLFWIALTYLGVGRSLCTLVTDRADDQAVLSALKVGCLSPLAVLGLGEFCIPPQSRTVYFELSSTIFCDYRASNLTFNLISTVWNEQVHIS